MISKMLFVLRQLYRITVLNCVSLIAACFPVNKRLIIFGGWNGKKFIDNSKHLFVFFQNQRDGFEKVWITKDKKLCDSINSLGYTAYYAYSLEGIYKQMSAATVIFNQSVEVDFISCLIKLNNLRVQLWHGTPIKKIGYSDKFNIYSKKIMVISNHIIPFYNDRLDMCIAIGEFDKKIYKEAFNVDENNVVITGYPRNDVFFQKVNIDIKNNRRIIYLPTLRNDFVILLRYLLEDVLTDNVDDLLNANDYDLFIKLHPAQLKQTYFDKSLKGKKRIHFIIQDSETDIYEEITNYSALITDISGVFFDLLLTNIKIYTYFPDKDIYIKNERELYYKIDDISVTENFKNFILLIQEIVSNNYDFEYHNQLKLQFHKYIDGNSSKRVYNEVIKRLYEI